MGTVAIFGAGVMGETLLSGLVRAGRDAGDIIVTERREDRAAELRAKYGVRSMSNADAAAAADTLVLVVKPQDMGGLLEEIRDHLTSGSLVVSLAAGITTSYLQERLPEGTPVVRVMPNTPALVDQGMAAISAGSHCDEAHLAEAEQVLREQVSSPGGTTMAALRQLDDHKVRAAFLTAMEAAAARSAELASGND